MSKWMVVAALAPSLLWATHTCTTCYIDYESGNDTWDGTAKTHGAGSIGPWKHAPGMLSVDNNNATRNDGCTGNCATQVPVAGDRYILKGGVVWPYTVLPWNWTWAGTSSTSGTYGCAGTGCIYIGYESTWNKGTVNSVTLARDLGGCNPASPPTVSFSGGGGINAAATAAVMPAAAGTTEPSVAGFITHVSVTNQGTGYTSNPTVTISGGGCISVKAVADIQRPIIDMGLGSSIAWNVGNGPNFGASIVSPGFTINNPAGYLILDHLEFRNLLQIGRGGGATCATASGGIVSGFISDIVDPGVGHNTIQYNYIHNRKTNCNDASGGRNQESGDVGIFFRKTDEVAFNILENGETLQLSTNSDACIGAGAGNDSSPCVFSEMSLYGVGGNVHHNVSYGTRWMVHEGSGPGELTVPMLFHDNETWLALYDYTSAHVNEYYFLYADGTLYNYNNIMHSAVSGASNQQQMGNGTTQYLFNNVFWGLGGGTPCWGIDPTVAAGASGGAFYFYNNTCFAQDGYQCVNSGSGSFNSGLTVTLQNNHCITNPLQNPYWGNGASGSTWKNQAGSTVQVNIQAASSVDTKAAAASQGYTVSSLYAPTANTNDTVTFASGGGTSNLTSLCTGNLQPLCKDINGVSRPASGGWQAGAYQYPAGPVAPIVTTTSATGITATSASSGGNVTSDGGAAVTARGVCYGVTANPTTPCTSDGTGAGVFTSSLTGLIPGTLYHYRAYATNSAGTAYGSDLTFTTANIVSGSAISGAVSYAGVRQ